MNSNKVTDNLNKSVDSHNNMRFNQDYVPAKQNSNLKNQGMSSTSQVKVEQQPENNMNNLGDFEKELWEAFQEFDTDGSGTIDKDEFSKFMQRLGYRPTLVELQEMLDEVDKDKNGQIGFDEFKLLMTRTIRDEFTQTSSIEAFSVFDKQKSGKISKDDLVSILLSKGEFPMNQTEIDELLKYVQFNEDGELNYADFVKNTFDLFK